MGLPSLKKELIIRMAILTLDEELKGSKVILITPAGIISGYLPEVNDLELSDADIAPAILTELADKITAGYRSEHSLGDELLTGNDGFITLTNVLIQMSGNQTATLPHLNVFYDQIIGITIGTI